MLDRNDSEFSVRKQCEILGINRSSLYYETQQYSVLELKILHRLDEIYTKYPFYGYRRAHDVLIEENYVIGEERVRRYKKILGLETFYPKRKTTIASKENKVYPYLLKAEKIAEPNAVWAVDITYIRLDGGFCYLVVILDWHSRYVLNWQLSNTLETSFCVNALEDALKKFGSPRIFNSDQGSQFTSQRFTGILLERKIQISMDSVGRWADNVIIERFFRSLKWEDIYLQNYESMAQAKEGISHYMSFYNTERKHSSLEKKTPAQVYGIPNTSVLTL